MRPQQRPFLVAITLLAIVAGLLTMNAQAAREKPVINPPPSLAELANATCRGIESAPITLTDGHWEGEPYQPGAASRPTVGLLKSLVLHGDLNGDEHPESVAILWANNGGSGTQLYIAVFARQGDKIVNLQTTDIGDRVQIRDGRIEGRGIVLDVIQAGPEDAACCPGQKARRSWMLVNEEGEMRLEEMPAHLVGRLSLADIENIDWQLRESGAEKTASESTPSKAITLHIKGNHITGFSGCNRYQASITSGDQPGAIKISGILNTRMACPEKDMARERRFVQQLAKVSRFSFSAGELLFSVNSSENNAATTLTFQTKPQQEN